MTRRLLLAAALVALVMTQAVPASAIEPSSPFAFGLLARTDTPELWLAQRTIDREWVAPDDPEAIANTIPGGKSEMGAMAMSGILPGTGQLYAGEKSGYAFLLAEALGWAGLFYFDNRADDQYNSATTSVGAPSDTTSSWSFQRYANQTGNDPAGLEQLYVADPSSFWYAVAHDDRLAAGWSSGGSRTSFADELARSDGTRRHAGQASGFLWLNHILSAADAFRSARIYNLPLQRNLELKTKASLLRGRPSVTMTVVRKF
ncbi:MAG: hypothetical protein ACHQ52_06395 [Candidatus Eisenbacteria bacterium]